MTVPPSGVRARRTSFRLLVGNGDPIASNDRTPSALAADSRVVTVVFINLNLPDRQGRTHLPPRGRSVVADDRPKLRSRLALFRVSTKLLSARSRAATQRCTHLGEHRARPTSGRRPG